MRIEVCSKVRAIELAEQAQVTTSVISITSREEAEFPCEMR